ARQYSLCGDPVDRAAWEVAVLKDPASRGGSAWIHSSVKPGTVVRVRGARNHFRMGESHARRYVVVPGGSGIPPVLPMARRARDVGRGWWVQRGCRHAGGVGGGDELEARHRARLALDIREEGRRNDVDALAARLAGEAGVQISACGPTRMLEALQAAVTQAGL